MSVAVALKLTDVPPPPADGTVIVPGSESDGGVVSCTVTLKPIDAVSLVTVSVNVHDTDVVPRGNVPAPGAHEAVGAPLSSVTPLRSKETEAPLELVASAVMSGMDPEGGSADARGASAPNEAMVMAAIVASRRHAAGYREHRGADLGRLARPIPQRTINALRGQLNVRLALRGRVRAGSVERPPSAPITSRAEAMQRNVATRAVPRTLSVCLAHLDRDEASETFIRAHAALLPCRVSVVHGTADRPLFLDDFPLASSSVRARGWRFGRRAALRAVGADMLAARYTPEYRTALRRSRADVALAEFGPVGVQAMDACRVEGVPLVVHFHGYDASSSAVLAGYSRSYRRLFAEAAALVAPSEALRLRLLSLGAPPGRTYTSANGVDCTRFLRGQPERAEPVFVAVGRLVEKKAPQLTIEAFAKVLAVHPTARLRFIGTGPLREQCEELAKLRCGRAVEFLGEQPHDAVVRELQTARAFVQHSVVAPDGDMEGMPVSVIEAGASGLPVVSTRHSGIADIVVDGVTGFLVEEGGVDAMAARMAELVERPALAGALGRAARRRVEMHFGIDASIDRLRRILEHAAGGEGARC